MSKKRTDESIAEIVAVLEIMEYDMEWVRRFRDGNGTPGIRVILTHLRNDIDELRRQAKFYKKVMGAIIGAGFSIVIFILGEVLLDLIRNLI